MARKFSLDESVFDTLTPESAYWLGFLMADGCVFCQENRIPMVSICLGGKDREHLVKFLQFIKSPGRAITQHRDGSFTVQVKSKRLVECLASYGITPRKSFTAKAIGDIAHNPDFWRGVIDGDGCVGDYICKSTKQYGRKNYVSRNIMLQLCGSKDICEQFLSFAHPHVPGCRASVRFTESDNMYVTALGGKYAKRIISELYGGSTIYLDRKYEKAMSIVGERNEV